MRKPTWREKALGLLIQSTCYCCGDYVPLGYHLCRECEESLRFYRVPRLRTVSRNGLVFHVRACFYYQEAAKLAVKRFKFCGNLRGGKYMGEAVAARVLASKAVSPDIITFVPNTVFKRLQRGFNSSAVIAESVGKHLHLPVKALLYKVGETRGQHTLSKVDRKENIKNVFEVRGSVCGKRILLIDDVVTTGSTICECARVLLNAGAEAVWTIAYASVGGKPRVDREDGLRYNERDDL